MYIRARARDTCGGEPIDPRIATRRVPHAAVALGTLVKIRPTHFRNKNREFRSLVSGTLPSQRIFTVESAGNRRPYTGICIQT